MSIEDFLPQSGFWRTMVLAGVPAVTTLAGALLAEFITISRMTLSLSLHSVAGLLLAVLGVELMPQMLESEHAVIYAGLFMAGSLFTLGLDWAIDLTGQLLHGGTHRKGRKDRVEFACRRPGKHDLLPENASARSAAWVIFFGVAIDFITDGLMLVTGSDVSPQLGIMLGIALVAADTPEAFATIANMKKKGGPRHIRVMLALSFPVILLGGALLGEWLLRGAPEILQVGVLAFTAGIILTLVESEIIPETFENWDGMFAALVLTGSFIAFALVSAFLG